MSGTLTLTRITWHHNLSRVGNNWSLATDTLTLVHSTTWFPDLFTSYQLKFTRVSKHEYQPHFQAWEQQYSYALHFPFLPAKLWANLWAVSYPLLHLKIERNHRFNHELIE